MTLDTPGFRCEPLPYLVLHNPLKDIRNLGPRCHYIPTGGIASFTHEELGDHDPANRLEHAARLIIRRYLPPSNKRKAYKACIDHKTPKDERLVSLMLHSQRNC